MPRVCFTANLRRHLPVPEVEAAGATVAEVLAEVFAAHERLRGYVLDDQGRLRLHVNVFVGDRMVTDRLRLSDPVATDDEIYIMQALSGG
ncbi:MAG: MoaD/ThiS family protein [Acidobacteriota bacterium]